MTLGLFALGVILIIPLSAAVLLAFSEDRRLSEDELRTSSAAFGEVMAVWGLVIDDVIAAFAHGARLLTAAAERHVAPEQLRAFFAAVNGAEGAA